MATNLSLTASCINAGGSVTCSGSHVMLRSPLPTGRVFEYNTNLHQLFEHTGNSLKHVSYDEVHQEFNTKQ